MAETAAIAKMAEKVSNDIFTYFGWERKPHRDLNFPCDLKEHKKTTHPCDVVFHYNSPLSPKRIFLNTDLKSYAKGSITSSSVAAAINSLILAVDCANRSQTWMERYAGTEENFDVHGLLFVYNHDEDYDSDWPRLLSDAKINTQKIPGSINQRIYVLGPTDIQYLISVADDIRRQRGSEDLPSSANCSFHYPDMSITRVKRNFNQAASMELLTSPWQVLHYSGKAGTAHCQGVHCYYRGEGKTADEFKFLIDYLFRFQLVGDENKLSVRMPFATTTASSAFENAKEQYLKDYHSLPEFKGRLDRITFEKISLMRQSFDEEQLGMER